MNLQNTKVFILCGGKGERLRPLTDDVPKPLVPIHGRPILEYLISYFKSFGVRRFVVAVGYKAEKVEEYFRTHFKDLEIQLVNSGDADILKRLQDGSRYLCEDFFLCYGDTLANVDLKELMKYHASHSGNVTITSYPLQSQFGILDLAVDGKVQSFVEKPVLDKWINIGYYYFDKDALKNLQQHSNFIEYIQSLITDGELHSYRHRGLHITVNTIKELNEAEDNIGAFNKEFFI